MVGLSASELQAETLFPGDTIEYFSIAFVAGDPRGHRMAKVLRVDHNKNEFPIEVDTQELLPLTMMLKRKRDRKGLAIASDDAKWRKLRTFGLVDGEVEGETRADRLHAGLKTCIFDAMNATKKQLAAEKQEQSCVRSKQLMSTFLTTKGGGLDEGETSSSQRSSCEEGAVPERKKRRQRSLARDATDCSSHVQPLRKLVSYKSRCCDKASQQSRCEDETARSQRQFKYDIKKTESKHKRRSDSMPTRKKTVYSVSRANQLSISKYFCGQQGQRQSKKVINKFVNHVRETESIQEIEAQKRFVWGLDEYYALDAEKKALEAGVDKLKGNGVGEINIQKLSYSRTAYAVKTSCTRQRERSGTMKGESDALRSWLKPRDSEKRQDESGETKCDDDETSQRPKQRLQNVASDKSKSNRTDRSNSLCFIQSDGSVGTSIRTNEVAGSAQREATQRDFRHRNL
uniref:Uncharacterized protein n=1 Tax=Peronospora matthiolae TaxID=2874970 RepID=A0AAV1U020_9STRA